MSDPNYPDDIRQYDSDPRSPFYKDETESTAYQKMFDRLLEDHAEDPDICIEGIGELDAFTASRLSVAFLAHREDTEELSNLLEIGRIVYDAIERYCTPEEGDVLDALHRDDE